MAGKKERQLCGVLDFRQMMLESKRWPGILLLKGAHMISYFSLVYVHYITVHHLSTNPNNQEKAP